MRLEAALGLPMDAAVLGVRGRAAQVDECPISRLARVTAWVVPGGGGMDLALAGPP